MSGCQDGQELSEQNYGSIGSDVRDWQVGDGGKESVPVEPRELLAE